MEHEKLYNNTLAEIVTKSLLSRISEAGPGHCMRLEGLPSTVLDDVCLSLNKESIDAKVVSLSTSPSKSFEVTATKLVELRNLAEESFPLLVLIPANLRTGAEDSFERSTFQQIEATSFEKELVGQLETQAPIEFQSYFRRIREFFAKAKREIRDHSWATYLSLCAASDYKESCLGPNLFALDLIPDSALLVESDRIEQRLFQNCESVKQLTDETIPLLSRINSLNLEPQTLQRELFQFLSRWSDLQVVSSWSSKITDEEQYKHLDLEHWSFVGLRTAEDLQLFVHPLKGKSVTWNDGEKSILTKGNRAAKLSVSFETLPSPAELSTLANFRIDLMRTAEGGILEKVQTLTELLQNTQISEFVPDRSSECP